MSYDSAMEELRQLGIVPDSENKEVVVKSVSDEELNLLNQMEVITNTKYSEQQKEILLHKGNLCMLACAGSGKALVNGTGVLTPSGYVPIETLKVGDKVFDNEGLEQIVLGVYPQSKKRVYKVKFSDGAVISCCNEHLWTYQTYNMRRTNKKWVTHDIEYILNNVNINVYKHTNKKGETQNRANIYIPMCKPINFNKKELPIEPYTLGALLGDGCIRNHAVNCSLSFTNEDSDVINKVQEGLQKVGAELKYIGKGFTYRIAVGSNGNNKSTFTKLLEDLKLLNTDSSTKFIPDVYKMSSIEDRLNIIKGLIDTDGHCNGSNYELTLKSEKLIDDVKFILETLGMTSTKSTKIASCTYKGNKVETQVYRLYIKTSELIPKIHSSERREKQWKKGQTWARRTITNIEETDEFEEMTCIKVSGESELFLTEHCIVTHNTTSLTHLISKRIITGEIKDTSRLVCTTYSKGGATEMEDRLHKLLQTFGMDRPIKVVTMHAFFLSILKTFKVGLDVLSDDRKRFKFIAESAKEANFELRDNDIDVLSNLLSYQVNNLMSDKKALESEANTLDDLTLEQYAVIRKGYASRKSKERLMDFDDMQMYLWKWLVKDKTSEDEAERISAQNVRNYCKAMWDYFYIDESQDISKIQFAIIKEMVADPEEKGKLDKDLVFVGDDDQCIYQWRGADPSIILNIGNMYDLPVKMLSTNYRCCRKIVDFAEKSIVNNSARYAKDMRAFKDGGKVQIAIVEPKHNSRRVNPDLNELSEVAFDYVKRLIDNGESPSDICIMSRNNFHLAILSNMLLHAGIYTESSNDMKLTKSAIYNDIKIMLELASNKSWDSTLTKTVLWKMCKYMSVANAGHIANFQDSAALTLKDALGYMCKFIEKANVNFDKNIKMPIQAELSIKQRWNRLNSETRQNLVMLYSILCDDDITNRIVSMFTMYINCAGELLYKREDKKRSLNGICNYIYLMIKKYGYDGTMEFLRVTEQYEQGSLGVPGEKVTLTTIHSAKGKEWKNVIAFAVDNISMPSIENIGKMLSEGQTVADINKYIDEERRLYYVEMTRARENLLVITGPEPSVFVMESIEGIDRSTSDDVELKSTNSMIIDLANSDHYIIDKQKKNIFNAEVIKDKILSKEGEYFYDSECTDEK